MSEQMNKNVGKIRSFFKKTQGERHPITGHPIAKCEEYVRGLYFDMLCVVAQYENDDIENQNVFIQRIMSACEESMPFTEHVKRSMEINEEKVSEFILQCKNNDLQDIFMVDALIIACANGTPNKQQVDFLAELADAFGMNKENTVFIAKLALSIIEQSLTILKNTLDECTHNDKWKYVSGFSCYIKEFVEGIPIDSYEKFVAIYAPKSNFGTYSKGRYSYEDSDEIIIENQYIDNATIEFNNVEKIILKNCYFEGSNITEFEEDDSFNYPKCSEGVIIHDAKDVIIENCCFEEKNSVLISMFPKAA